jgi:hypothetical protein
MLSYATRTQKFAKCELWEGFFGNSHIISSQAVTDLRTVISMQFAYSTYCEASAYALSDFDY